MIYTTSASVKTVGFLAALSMLLSACNPPATPTTTAAPTGRPVVTATSGPTSTPAPSPTPRPPVNPALIDREPARGQELQVDKPIVLTFDQAMDRSSVEQSVQVLNNASGKSVSGRFTWKNDATASFLPSDTANWDRATQYTISLKDSAKSARGLALARPQSFNISTIGYLDVAQTIPSSGAKEVAADARITVLFNRPVVPLTAIGQQEQLPSPVKFTPDIEGKGEWLNTSIYLFRPSKPLAAGIDYKGVVAAGLKDTTGALLQKEFTWSFSIAAPTIKALSPENTTIDVDLHRPISVTFSQKMDHASAESAFKITPAVQGSFRWASEQVDKNQGPQYRGDKRQLAVGTPPQAVAAAGEVMAFVPDTAFERSTSYKVEIGAGARALLGSSGTPSLRSFSFTTIKLPGVASTAPANGDNKADSSNGFTLRFTAPVASETIVPNLRFEPALTLTKVYSYYDAHDKSFYLNLQLMPSTAYKVTIGGDIADQYGVKIGKDKIVQFTTAPLMPYAVLNSNGTMGTYDAAKPTKLFTTYRNVSKLNLELAALTPDQFYQFTGADGSYEHLRTFKPADSQVVRRWSLPTSAGLNEVAFASVSLAADGGSLTPGIYLLTLTAPEAAATVKYYEPARHILVVSSLHVTLKQAEREALVWVTNLQDGKPEAGLPVSFRDKSFNEIKKGTVANDGQLLVKFEGAFEEYTPFYAVISEPGKNDFGIAYNRWDTGINPYDFGLQTQFGSTRFMAYLYTERPIYRPGQMVYYKGIVRSEDDARYTLASGISSTDITINNDQGQQVFSTTLPVSANGTFSGAFALDNAAATGYYYVQTCLPFDVTAGYKGNGVGSPVNGPSRPQQCRNYSVQFQVSAYRLPEFEVSVKPAKTDYLAGDSFNAGVDARFFFGGNVSNAKVQWTLFARDYYFDKYKGTGNYSFGDYDTFYRGVSYNEQVANGIGQTDANGHLDITASADISKRKNSAVYSLEVSVTDANDQSVSGRAEALIHKSDYYLGIAPEDYVGASGREMKFNVISVDWQGQPIADKVATVSYYQREWFTTLEQDKAGNSAYTSVPSDTLASTSDIKTDADGKAISSLTPKAGGEYRAVVKGEGAAGPVSAASVYVSSGGDYVGWRVNNNDRIDLKTDRQEYKVGDTVKLLVPSPYSGTVTALLTLERGRFLMHKVVVLKTNSDIIEIPVEAGYAPNAFATVVLVKGVDADNPVPAYKVGMVGFKVDPGQFALHVDVATIQQTYAPRDTVTYDIRVTDAAGNPVKAELSLAVVDKAVLSLADPNSLPILDAFYGARGLGVHTADSLNINVDRITARIIAENAKGGGGGGLAGALDTSGFTRQDFKDVALWAAVVNTDENGKASVQVRLPDNLTTWTMDARAITADSKAGQAAKEIISTKPLLIRPVAPRFFVVGDRVTLGAVVNNNTDRDLQATATLDAKGVTIADATPQNVTVKAKGSTRVDWQATVDDAASAVLTFAVKDNSVRGLVDSSKPGLATAPDQGIPILHYSSPETVATAGDVSEPGKKLEVIGLPPRLDTGQGQLDIQVDPALAAVIKTGDRVLQEYPYDNVETTASRLIVSAAVKNSATPDNVTRAIQRLLGSQHSDGGWGWWIQDDSNNAMTAYALLALARAQAGGFSVDNNAMSHAREYLTNQLVAVDKRPSLANQQAFLLFALTESGADDSGRLGQLYENRDSLNNASKALLAMSLDRVNQGDTRIAALLSDLNSAAVSGATGVMWQEKTPDYFTFGTNTRSTAIVLNALARLDPNSALSANAVRWLMAAREGETWQSNQEIAWSVMALTEWSDTVGEKTADYTWRVSLNGDAVMNGQAGADALGTSAKLAVAVAQLLRGQSNDLVFERGAGAGRLYYTARLKVYLPADEAKALDRGIVIARRYELADCKPEPEKPCDAITSAKIGQNVRVRLTIVAPNDLHFVQLTDPLPGGAEAVDTSLKTSQQTGAESGLQEIGGESGWGWWWFSHAELRDDHAALFASYLPAGTYEYTYLIRPSIAGTFKVMPASVQEAYFPETFGRSDGSQFAIAR